MILSTRNLSLKGNDHKPESGFEAASTFMTAANPGESLMGRGGAFCNEKSWRPLFVPGTAKPPCVRSTENDIDRTSGLKSEFFFESEFPQRTTAGYTADFEKIPWASRAASLESRPAVTSRTSNWARAQTPLACVPRASGRCCWAA